ncbi:hypothetical protein [Chitinibacter tainanensis]|uniref:hypothetical protein n=1 Tax=Chitinibacter tainanensis TaxID=230667 RepID=UPI002354C72B|nr:hypothetical protein [Chitinibacter tainanensis]
MSRLFTGHATHCWQFAPNLPEARGHYAFILPEEDQHPALIDALCRHYANLWRAPLALLEARPVFVSNLRVWENIILPTWYHAGAPLSELDARMQAMLAGLQYDEAALQRALAQLPAQLDTPHRRLAALLRALLQHPQAILLDEAWLAWLAQSRARGSLLSQLYDRYTALEYVFVLCNHEAPEGYTPISCRWVSEESA